MKSQTYTAKQLNQEVVRHPVNGGRLATFFCLLFFVCLPVLFCLFLAPLGLLAQLLLVLTLGLLRLHLQLSVDVNPEDRRRG